MRTLTAGRAIRAGELEIIPIELCHAGGEQTPAGLMAFGMKEPVAIVIRSPRGEWAFDLDGNEISISDARFSPFASSLALLLRRVQRCSEPPLIPGPIMNSLMQA